MLGSQLQIGDRELVNRSFEDRIMFGSINIYTKLTMTQQLQTCHAYTAAIIKGSNENSRGRERGRVREGGRE
jgi:hypothetical protein